MNWEAHLNYHWCIYGCSITESGFTSWAPCWVPILFSHSKLHIGDFLVRRASNLHSDAMHQLVSETMARKGFVSLEWTEPVQHIGIGLRTKLICNYGDSIQFNMFAQCLRRICSKASEASVWMEAPFIESAVRIAWAWDFNWSKQTQWIYAWIFDRTICVKWEECAEYGNAFQWIYANVIKWAALTLRVHDHGH